MKNALLRPLRPLLLALTALMAFLVAGSASAEPATRVYLNGKPTPVYFNDGDSFRVLAGPLKGTKARLSGYNTLESFGPVHQWGEWTELEMYHIAKMATYNAQKGIWRCESDLKRDTYGRILWWCKDLALNQVKRGLAHAMSVDAKGADPELLAAMQDAMANKRGMWAHGVPPYVLTSLHSISEGGGKDGKTYNRLVSTVDGHSEQWLHTTNYGECEKVCNTPVVVTPESQARIREALKVNANTAPFIGSYSDDDMNAIIVGFANSDGASSAKDKAHKDAIIKAMTEIKAKNMFETTPMGLPSCMTYVDFLRRFGAERAACLKK